MAKNYFIAYDLNAPGKNYENVKKGILSAGTWYMHLQKSLYYLVSDKTRQQVYDAIKVHIDVNDSLAVIEAEGAIIYGLKPPDRQSFVNLFQYGTPTLPNVA